MIRLSKAMATPVWRLFMQHWQFAIGWHHRLFRYVAQGERCSSVRLPIGRTTYFHIVYPIWLPFLIHWIGILLILSLLFSPSFSLFPSLPFQFVYGVIFVSKNLAVIRIECSFRSWCRIDLDGARCLFVSLQ